MKKLNRIQLRGISRTPSDRLNSDGGVAESLNMYIEDAESAPALLPKDVTGELGLPDDLVADKVFLHKAPDYEHYFVQLDNEVVAYVDGLPCSILTLSERETLNDITSVGNIVILSATESVYYVLWKKDQYELIGNQLPVPAIQIEVVGNDDETFYGKRSGRVAIEGAGTIPGMMAIAEFQKGAWEEAARGVAENEDVNTAFRKFTSDFWASVQTAKNKIGKWGFFSCPRFVRYAVKLYDGSYVYHSVPILIGAGEKEWLSATGSNVPVGDKAAGLYYYINLFYKAIAKLVSWDVEGWEDIIEGVDIFISTDIAFPAINEDFATCDDGGGKIYFKGYDEAIEKTKEEVLSKVLFYKVESIAVRDLDSLKKGIDLHRHDFVEQDEDLVVRDRLTSDYMTSHKVIPRTMQVYNNSLLVNAARIEYPDPYPLLGGLFCNSKLDAVYGKYQVPKTYQMKFHMRRNNGEEYSVMARNPQGGFNLVTPLISNGAPSHLEQHWYARPMAWLAYPDVNCYEVEIFSGDGEIVYIPMSQHPGLSISYAFVGLDLLLEDASPVGVVEQYDYSEKKTYEVANQVMMSEINNPFIFPVAKRNTLQSSIIGTAIATTALSQGQFGQFPLYVFTEDGIWAMETAADGSFVTSKPLSRDVCVNPDSITPIDSAVVFVTDKGVMMLQGSQVVNLSPNMNGRHYTLEETAKVVIKGQEGFQDLIPVVTDSTHFMAFVKDATIAYDYPGRRLIFIKADEAYQYIYKLDTNTWHKTAYGISADCPVNSYPECLVQGKFNLEGLSLYVDDVEGDRVEQTFELFYDEVKDLGLLAEEQWREMFFNGTEFIVYVDEEKKRQLDRVIRLALALPVPVSLTYDFKGDKLITRIYNLSTPLDIESQTSIKGIIATRPFDLGAPDVLKTITDIRIRGNYTRGAVKFMLLGSMDGINFYVIGTKRGKAWKLFRLIILADLLPTERISWVDVEYDERFTNRLR